MHKFIGAALASLLLSWPVIAQEHNHATGEHAEHEMAHGGGAGAPFSLLDSSRKTLTEAQLTALEAQQTMGRASDDKKSLTYDASTIRLVVRTGPEDDMLSFRIQGLRNPTLVVPQNATLNVLFANTDEDMPHDVHFSALRPPFAAMPSMQNAVGSAKLPHEAQEKYAAQELSLRATKIGSYTYFCSVTGHAKGGMFGFLVVGTQPTQADYNNMPPQSHDEHSEHGAMGHEMSGHEMHSMGHEMHSTVDLNDPMSRESSGTSWLPDSSPMYMKMRMKGDKMLMFHGTAFPRYTRVGSDRDVSIAGKGSRSRFDAPTMFMGMYSQPAGEKGQLGVRLMASLDPIIERGYGYPLLYQSGEAYKGLPIHDRQHPHDLISELSATYSRRLSGGNSAYLYLGYPGEPALGPPTFMHRISAMDNPDAPISHHWQDSTHITFGVATAGFSTGKWKLEGSAFKGEEPDENRYNFDKPRLDSFSGRLSWNPNSNWALQVSHGYLKKPEPADPTITSRHRTTASAIYNKPLGEDSNWSNALVWGQNSNVSEGKTNSYLFETNYQRRANTFYARVERVQKSGHELVLPAPDDDKVFDVGSYAIGYVRDLKYNKGIDMGLGAQLTFNTNPAGLNPYYGGKNHTGFQIFLRLRPSRMKMDSSMSGMNMQGMKMDEGHDHSNMAHP